MVVVFLYGFLVGINGLEAGIEEFGSGFSERLLRAVDNPVAGLCIGILATALVQSSSVSTSTIVGLVGAGALTIPAAAPMIMGTNIGTTITNTIVSLGHVRRGMEFRRAFAGATVHDFFNVLTVMVALPLELAFGVLSRTAGLITSLLRGGEGISGVTAESPINLVVGWPVVRLEQFLADTSSFIAGVIFVGVGVVLIFLALIMITKTMRILMAGGIERAMNRMLGRGVGLGGIMVGLVVTILVQSSSITTAILIPMLAAGVLTLQNAYPVTLGTNVGTTLTAIVASLALTSPAALTIALIHTLFNVFGILLFYPIPIMRSIPIRLATTMARIAHERARYALAYVVVVFILLPLLGVLVLA
ncbi:MAG: sodium dependent phosphate transporter [Acidimicrobiia bacterium]|nr:sodium dependent phosphate transporter [Acidimicrobiia bacterium]